ncbi:MAG: Glycosyltransferase [Methanophagales archaeon]|nr:Glycosyltransferase [Methanophagales archaeon]
MRQRTERRRAKGSKMPKISVVVPTLNEEAYIERCLKSLSAQNFPHEIIVVDGGSKDKTVQIADEYADKVFVVRERGIAYARVFGAKNASARLIYTTDADCYAPNRSLLQHFYDEFASLNARSRVVALSGITKFPKLRGKLLERWYYLYGRFISPFQLGVVSLNGQNAILERDALIRCVAGKKLPLFMDDNFFSIHLKKFGKIIFSNSPKLANFGSERRVRSLTFALKSLYRYLIAARQLKKYGTVYIEQIR